ncbi:FAD-dependent oxidoreductase [Bradyrhizobium sp. RT9a]|uniref:NAD(P)/FAD-dependent oxidoreductase n=1 Tax=Bradyrhizobium sp. RT9a TaxID=3156384 RepID=UPI003393AA25
MDSKTLEEKTKVVVIGAGIIGLMTAVEIQRTGRQVIIVEPGEPGGRQAASYGNAGWISPAAIMPISVPGLWRRVPGFLMDKSGPFTIRWRYLPQLSLWLFRFVLAGRNWKKIERCAQERFKLCRYSPRDHQNLAAEAGVSHLIEQKGLLLISRNRSELVNGFWWHMCQRLGVKFTEFDPVGLRQLEPNISERYQYGVRIDEGCHCTDPQAYCEAIAQLIRVRGGEFIQARATGFETSGGHLVAVKLGKLSIKCTEAVVTAGIGSQMLAAAAGDRVALVSERGYHVVIPNAVRSVNHPIMPSDGQMAITPTQRGLRIAGQVELATVDAAPNWRRSEILLNILPTVFRASLGAFKEIDRWMGHRPSTPDGLPCIGAARYCAGLFYGFGHGHSGLAQAPATAKLLALLVSGELKCDIAALSVQRF